MPSAVDHYRFDEAVSAETMHAFSVCDMSGRIVAYATNYRNRISYDDDLGTLLAFASFAAFAASWTAS